MAYGIEDIAKMQVTGPVKGGDMVMKPNQAPVGAAALLNKMSRQNTPGIFKLPMPDKQMPDFMKVAAEGVEQQTAKGDSINQMAGQLMRQGINIQGMGMDEIITIYEQVFGSPGDVDQFGVSENLFPGNFTNKEQDVVMLPKNLKTGPDNPETELAYITDDEQALLAFMKPGTPHVGPENVPTYDEGDYLDYRPSGMGGTGYQGPTSSQISGAEGSGPGTGAIQEAMLESALAGDTDMTYQQAAQEAGYDFAQPAAVENQQAEIQAQSNINEAMQSLDTSQQNLLNAINRGDKKQAQRFHDSGVTLPTSYLTIPGFIAGAGINIISDLMDTKTDTKDKKDETTKEESDFEKLLRNIGQVKEDLHLETLAGGPFTLFPAAMKMIADPKAKQMTDDDYMAIMEGARDLTGVEGMSGTGETFNEAEFKDYYDKHKDIIKEGLKDLPKGEKGAGDSAESFAEYMQQMSKGAKGSKDYQGSEAQRRLDKADFYGDVAPQTSGGLEQLGGEKTFTKADMAKMNEKQYAKAKAFNQKVFNAREEFGREKRDKRQDRHPGTGIPVEQVTEEEEVVTTTDPRAGAFNVGGTMPYTHDVATGGTQMDVPLGRRFDIDKAGKYRGTTGGMGLNEAMDYATLGGYSQLEPFQEYLTRRRKHLGEDEPVYFDEEGNVIYSGTETT